MKARIADQLAATLAGMLIALLMVAAIAPAAWAPTPRSSPQPDLESGTSRMTTDGVSPVPSPETAARTEASVPGAPPVPTPPPTTGTRPASAGEPRTSMTLRGIATWYDYRRGHAAAGWRGTAVLVCADRCVRVLLTDWCACPGGRVVDLDRRSFAVLAPPSVGVLRVTVTRATPAPPDTAMEDAP
jgi:hypothetical protein